MSTRREAPKPSPWGGRLSFMGERLVAAPTTTAAELPRGRLIVDPYSGCGAFNRVRLKITEKEHCHGRL